jgi:hypothetical protein
VILFCYSTQSKEQGKWEDRRLKDYPSNPVDLAIISNKCNNTNNSSIFSAGRIREGADWCNRQVFLPLKIHFTLKIICKVLK